MALRALGLAAVLSWPTVSSAATIEIIFDIGPVTSAIEETLHPTIVNSALVLPSDATISGQIVARFDSDAFFASTDNTPARGQEITRRSGTDVELTVDPSITALQQPALDDTQAGYTIAPTNNVSWGTVYMPIRTFGGSTVLINDRFTSAIVDGTTREEHTEVLRLSIGGITQWERGEDSPISPDDLPFHTPQSFLSLLGDFYDDGVMGSFQMISRTYTQTDYRDAVLRRTTARSVLNLTADISLFSVSIDGEMQDLAALNEMPTVPLPAGAVLLLSGLGMLGFGARRKARKP